jgi:ABC-type methionine transport system ATPase subunit
MVFQHFSLFDTHECGRECLARLRQITSVKRGDAAHSATKPPSMVWTSTRLGLCTHFERGRDAKRVEIIRALLTEPKLLILDEPTSVLTPQAVEKLFVVLKKLVSEGCSLLYISHKLHEIRELCTACTVLRGGEVTGVCNPRDESNAVAQPLDDWCRTACLETSRTHAWRSTCFKQSTCACQRKINLESTSKASLICKFALVKWLALRVCQATGKVNCFTLYLAKIRARLHRPSNFYNNEVGHLDAHDTASTWLCILCPKKDWVVVQCPL